MKFIKLITISLLLIFATSANAQGSANATASYQLLSDGTIELNLKVDVEAGWYMYSAKAVEFGPMPTVFEESGDGKYELVGGTLDVKEPKTKYDDAFGMDVLVFEGQGEFKQIIKPLTDQAFTLVGTLVYQTCNGAECLINDADVSINIQFEGEVKEAPAAVATPTSTEKGEPMWSFLLIAFLAGLGAIITPCVFPMIPMTVSFLVGGEGGKGAGIAKGLIFGISVTLIYTALGLVVSLFQSTAATDAMGTHWIPNILFAVLFIVFAISFFGAFEITLPSGLANKADQKADKGGFIAAFFVALAMVIVSFSCTGPFVGSILAAAVVGGMSIKPILGMAAFGFAFALPFVVFSFFPGVMKKMPKSGGWLNVVKVVFAFVLLGFGIKFLYNVDAYFGLGVITRGGFIAIWVAMSFLLGMYFLGIIKTHHDSPISGLGWGRIMAAIATFAFGFYLLTGLFGAPLKSVSGLIPPQDGSTISLSSGGGSSSTSSGFSSLTTYPTLDEAVELSKESGKQILIYFTSKTCSVCKQMEATVLNTPEILDRLKNEYIIAKLYVDNKTPDEEFKTLGRKFRNYQTSKFGSASQPLYAILDSEENIISGPIGSSTVEEFSAFLK